jgi:hypothetical protein
MEMILIKEGSAEWERMWDWVAGHPLNEGLEEPSLSMNSTNNEFWQYIGSFRSKDVVIHEFRHASHPLTNDVEYLKKRADTVTDEDIAKVLKVK